MTTDHDKELGEALRALDVPEHEPGFFDRLDDAIVPRRRRRRPYVRLLVGAAAAAAVVAIALIGLDRPGTKRLGPQPASAADVVRRVTAAYASADSLTGTLVIRNVEGSFGGIHTMRWSFALRSNGDVRISELPSTGGGILFLAGKGEELSSDGPHSSAPVYGDRHGLAPGPPDTGPTDSMLQRDLGSVLTALAAGRDPRLRPTTYRGRPAWILEKAASLHLVVPEEPTDHLAVTVDKQTAFPVRIVETYRGRFVSEIRVDGLAVDAATAHDFTVQTAPGQTADASDVGFEHVPLERASASAGYKPLAPAWLPDGYARAETAVARVTDPTAMGQNPVSRDVVSTAYRRGISQFIVTTRRTGADAAAWVDPLAVNEHARDTGRSLELRAGALKGQTGRLVVTAGEVPHVWVVTPQLVVTVSGDLTAAELARVAESLAHLD